MERRLNFEGTISHLFLKAKQPNDQIGKILCPRIKTVKKMNLLALSGIWMIRIMTGATVSIKILSSLWFSLLINTSACRPISSRLRTVRLRASPFNITIIQVYTPTSSYNDSEVDEFYRELQPLADQTPKQDILVVQGDWNAKVGEDAQEDRGEVYGTSCNLETNDRGLKLLDFATYNNLVLANTRGNHEPSTSPDGTHHNQIGYILVTKRFRSGINTARTRTFPGADVGSGHDMVMMTFQTRLKI